MSSCSVKETPRIDEIERRLETLQNLVNENVEKGKVSYTAFKVENTSVLPVRGVTCVHAM